MPMNRELIAKASGFQHNCALNALVHKLVPNLLRNDVPAGSIKLLRERFNAYYGSNLDEKEFRDAISNINNPFHREVILAPVLRTMLLMREVTDPYRFDEMEKAAADNPELYGAFERLRPEIRNPGVDIGDREVMPLANFFGIRVESYYRQHFTRVVLEDCQKESLERRRVGLSKDESERITKVLATLNGPNPNFDAAADALLFLAPPGLNPALLNFAKPMIIGKLTRFYAETFRYNYIEHQNREMFVAQNRVLAHLEADRGWAAADRKYAADSKDAADRKAALDRFTLKLWNQNGRHWEYEAESLREKTSHDQYYDRDRAGFYDYGCIDGNPNVQGEPDAANIRATLRNALNAKKLELSRILQQYEREQSDLRGRHGAGVGGPSRPLDPGFNAGMHAGAAGNAQNAQHAHNAQNNNAETANPFAGFANLFNGGNLFTEMGQRFFNAFTAPFKQANTEATTAALSSSQPKSFVETLMNFVIAIHSGIMKLASAFVGVKPIIDEIQAGTNRQTNPAVDLTTQELGNHPDARIFDEYVKLLPENARARLISIWLDKEVSKTVAMDELRTALEEAGLEHDVAFFEFKRKVQQVARDNPTLARHLLQLWREQVHAKSHVTGLDAAVRDKRKDALLVELEKALADSKLGREAFASADLKGRADAAFKAFGGSADAKSHADVKRDPEAERIKASARAHGIPLRHPRAGMDGAGIPFTPSYGSAAGSSAASSASAKSSAGAASGSRWGSREAEDASHYAKPKPKKRVHFASEV